MPDWSYHTLFRPLLFQLSSQRSRALALGAIGALARLPAGSRLIDLMGHMMPPRKLSRSIGPLQLASPVGLDAGIDPELHATAAFDRFGFGFLACGPVTLHPLAPTKPVHRIVEKEAIVYPEPLANAGLLATLKQLDKLGNSFGKHRPLATPLFGTIGHKPGASPHDAVIEQCFLMQSLAPYCAAFVLDTRYTEAHRPWTEGEWANYFEGLHEWFAESALAQPRFLSLPPDTPPARANSLASLALANGFTGIQIAGGCRFGKQDRLYGRPVFAQTREMLRSLRTHLGEDIPLIVGGGVIEPEQALQLVAEGADLLLLHSGLVYSGPGLPKRINEAILVHVQNVFHSESAANKKAVLPHWLSGVLLGIGMIVGGSLAWLVALTVVLLPYDEAFLGVNGTALHHINDRLLHFLSHDRISLAGTMVSIGILYAQLSYHGLRRRERWAQRIVLSSGIAGFASLFYFWGFGYFDPAHALLSLLLFPFFLHAIAGKHPASPTVPMPDSQNDKIRLAGLWGQLSFVVIGCGLLGAGIVISFIGMTSVFVPEDLAFMRTTAETLHAAHPRLISLIAHDRAGFGGALVADGLAVLLLTLWGFRRGARWIWWTLLLAGVPGFLAGIGIHFMVGYVDGWHLFPAYVAVAVFASGLLLSYPYLCAKNVEG